MALEGLIYYGLADVTDKSACKSKKNLSKMIIFVDKYE